jgi:hypothetical protein
MSARAAPGSAFRRFPERRLGWPPECDNPEEAQRPLVDGTTPSCDAECRLDWPRGCSVSRGRPTKAPLPKGAAKECRLGRPLRRSRGCGRSGRHRDDTQPIRSGRAVASCVGRNPQWRDPLAWPPKHRATKPPSGAPWMLTLPLSPSQRPSQGPPCELGLYWHYSPSPQETQCDQRCPDADRRETD